MTGVDISETQAFLAITGLPDTIGHGSGKVPEPRGNVGEEHQVEKRYILCTVPSPDISFTSPVRGALPSVSFLELTV